MKISHWTSRIVSACFVLLPLTAHAITPAARVSKLLAQMTREEKIALVANGDAGVARLGIPPLVPSDGPNGIRNRGPGLTAFPNGQVIAASWDRALAEDYGVALGEEAAGKGFNILLAPTVNILRVPTWGRAAETFGEDPYLAGQIVAAQIQGVQSRRVVAQVKHFAANNQEVQRIGNPLGTPPLTPAINVEVSERALHEIYFPAFKAAVQQGGAGSVMCSYPRINGVYACQNPYTLGALKNEWGFKGFVGPDAILAVRDPLAAIEAGTDNFQLGGVGAPATVLATQVSDAKLDDMTRRILTALANVGLLDGRAPSVQQPDVSTPAHQALAVDMAVAGSVLLENQNGALPIGSDIRSIAVIGYDAGPGTQIMEGGSPAVVGGPVVTPLTAITARAGQSVSVTYAPGTLGVVLLPVVPAEVLSPSAETGPGLYGTYYPTMDWTGSPVDAFVSATVDTGTVLIPGAYSARFTGTLTPTATGLHRFSLDYAGIARLFIDGELVARGVSEGLDGWIPGGPPTTAQGMKQLTSGTPVSVVIEYSTGSSFSGSRLHFGWQPPDALQADAVAAASTADVAIVFANEVTSEGMDRTSLALPGDQDRLIAAVATANPRTIVVLHTSGPVLMPWLADVAGVVQAWYPGQVSGTAIAAVLFGDREPGGRLPMTFPADETQGPARTVAQYPGVDGVVHYDEDIFVGYRFYDEYGQAPLFPFGYGLSYTSFTLDQLRVAKRRGGSVSVSVRVGNTGARVGAAVVQAYVECPAASAEPPNQLKAFAKVEVKPGKRRRVKLRLDAASFESWNPATRAWATTPGEYRIRVGTSSRDLPLQAAVKLKGSR